MGNKIITENDFFECSGGMMPSTFQARQSIVKRQDGAKYILNTDISTVSWVDFGCKKVMLLYAVVAAVAAAVAALCVATGGAALIAVCALAGAVGAIWGAVIGSLICGQLVAPTRKWIGQKSDFTIYDVPTITGDHYIQCDAFTYLGMSPEFITFNPQIKSWTQAIFRGGANFIGNVFEGMMAGAAIGGVAAGGYALFTSGSWAGAGNLTLQFVKSIPKNIAGNIIESYMLPGLGIRGVMTAQNVAAGYGETGEFSAGQAISDAKDGFFGMEIGTVDSGRKIYNSMRGASTGTATWQDYVGIALNLMPVGKGTRDLLDGKKKSGSAKTEGEAPSKMDETDTTKPKAKAEGDAPTKKVEGNAYETGGINPNKVIAEDGYRTLAEHIEANTRSIKEDANFSHQNIDIVENHLMRFPNEAGEMQAINKVMIERARNITEGKLEATPKDEAFLTHEIRESELMNKGLDYDTAHAQTCKEYGIDGQMEGSSDHPFYTDEAIRQGDLEWQKEAGL